jgi:hypothetical protein
MNDSEIEMKENWKKLNKMTKPFLKNLKEQPKEKFEDRFDKEFSDGDVVGSVRNDLLNFIKKEREQAVKEERERIIKALPKEKEEIKPTEYRYICYGGSVCTRIDDWGDKKIKECPYKGDINWAVPACEKCDGKINGDLINTEYEEYRNREIKQYNLALEEVKKIIN